jgi:hypothetical protein
MKLIRSIDKAIDRAVEYRPYITSILLVTVAYGAQFFLGGLLE